MNNMNPKTLTQWSIAAGFLGIISFAIALYALWTGHVFANRMSNKDFYYAGSALMYIAIWFKLGAIYHKGQ